MTDAQSDIQRVEANIARLESAVTAMRSVLDDVFARIGALEENTVGGAVHWRPLAKLPNGPEAAADATFWLAEKALIRSVLTKSLAEQLWV